VVSAGTVGTLRMSRCSEECTVVCDGLCANQARDRGRANSSLGASHAPEAVQEWGIESRQGFHHERLQACIDELGVPAQSQVPSLLATITLQRQTPTSRSVA
jgi:hypothetical protein